MVTGANGAQPIPWWNADNVGPAGSVNSNAVDMARWVALQLNDGVYHGHRLFSAAVAREMHTPQMLIASGSQLGRLFRWTEHLRPWMVLGIGSSHPDKDWSDFRWLEFLAEPDGASTVIRQIAQFEPRGLGGLLYWYLLWPVHEVMFRAMLRRIAAAALRQKAVTA